MSAKFPLSLKQLVSLPTQYIATLWKLEREDNVKFYFTDHSQKISFLGNTYTPAGGANQTANQGQDGIKELNKSFQGPILDNEAITHDDIRAGLYRNCKVTEYKIDWRTPWQGAFFYNIFYINKLEYTGSIYQAELTGLTSKIIRPIGRILSHNCDWILGQNFGVSGVPGCKFDLSVMAVTGSVTSVLDARYKFNTDTSTVKDSSGSNIPNENNWFKYGKVTFTSGNNNGLTREVSNSTTSGNRLVVEPSFPYDIEVGDTFTVYPGCDKRHKTCIDKFNNVQNYGGNPWIPGTDAMIRTPDAK